MPAYVRTYSVPLVVAGCLRKVSSRVVQTSQWMRDTRALHDLAKQCSRSA